MDLAPLYALRLRTPRLELRLPAEDELHLFRRVALAGIHPPEFMPFAVAWTDEPDLAGFAAFHHRVRSEWRRERWQLELGVWAEGEPAGFQGIMSSDFARTRAVETGSWLGARFQRRGYGTEMRTAVLELGFRGLGAVEARSGALDGNVASFRVSEKLGYRVTGYSSVSPRGEPIRHADLAIRREDWRAPFPVEIENLEPALPLFGV